MTFISHFIDHFCYLIYLLPPLLISSSGGFILFNKNAYSYFFSSKIEYTLSLKLNRAILLKYYYI
ncbi:hypothetical protein CLV62_110133 [Dysgonomonas alginatilytica]|uniref:Uncharacterized protein n=1 Tax=Dysgonomonas alginatilytica TaxID=1605892 RepID=A0A2V3PPQ8_9BACT|nr:hypothetical protein CLV62_110133 [Dysgonomonas alginatilytica]